MKCFNKVILKGFLGKAPDVRLLPSGDSVVNFSIATTIHNHTEWHKIVCFNKLAEYSIKVLGEGDFVYIEAQIKTREFKTSEDEAQGRKPRRVMELIAEEVQLISKKGVGHGEGSYNENKDGSDPEKPEKTEVDVDNELKGEGDSIPLPKYL